MKSMCVAAVNRSVRVGSPPQFGDWYPPLLPPQRRMGMPSLGKMNQRVEKGSGQDTRKDD